MRHSTIDCDAHNLNANCRHLGTSHLGTSMDSVRQVHVSDKQNVSLLSNQSDAGLLGCHDGLHIFICCIESVLQA